MECCVGRRSSGIFGLRSGLEPELNGSESFPVLTGHGEVPTLVCVYSDTAVVVTVLAEEAAPSSGQTATCFTTLSHNCLMRNESSYDAPLTDEETEQGGDPS